MIYPVKSKTETPLFSRSSRPEKVAVIANYNEVWNKFVEMGKEHIPIQSWNINYNNELKRESYHGSKLSELLEEGYQNPIIISALPAETRVPDTNKLKTLFVNPGDRLNEDDLVKYDVVWFKPGIHDLSSMGYAPFFQTRIKERANRLS